MKQLILLLCVAFALSAYAGEPPRKQEVNVKLAKTGGFPITRSMSFPPTVFYNPDMETIEIEPNTEAGLVQVAVSGPYGVIACEAADAQDGRVVVSLPWLDAGWYEIVICVDDCDFVGEFDVAL